MERLAFQPSDLDALWEAENEFWERLNESDWRRKHGSDWTFSDPLPHLIAHQQAIVDAIQRAPIESHPLLLKSQMAQDRWNEQVRSRRAPYQDVPQLLREFKASQIALREASHALDKPVFLPFLGVGGWRTLLFALEYTYYYHWLHFTESHLRRYSWLPGLPDRMMHIGLDFHMEMLAASVHRELAVQFPLRWQLCLTDVAGGTWTFDLNAAGGTVRDGQHGQPDITTSMTIKTFLETYVFKLARPSPFGRRVRIQGRQQRLLGRLFTPPPSMEWKLLERGRASSPTLR
jgi:hypothetical protein